MKPYISVAIALAALTALSVNVNAQEGTPRMVNSSTSTYTCNPATCVPPSCMCASKTAPGGLNPSDVPQFITVTYDDSIDYQLMNTANQLLQNKNPNGCPALGTWFVSIQYSNFSQVTEWYANGNEIADHTFTHVGQPPAEEISACKQALNAYGGIPLGKIQGFRAPFLNYTPSTFSTIKQQGFLYDSSTTSVIDDLYWPYTLDNGLANDCWNGDCAAGVVNVPGLWEIPMSAVVSPDQTAWLMDIYTSGSVTTLPNTAASEDTILDWYKTNFARHYSGGRAPMGVYVHPTHITNIPGLPDATASLAMLQSFLSWAAAQPNVWFVTNQQLLQWMQHPVPSSQLGNQSYMGCHQPVLPRHICNGLGDDSLTQSCSFTTDVWSTCYNCPATGLTVATPVPPASTASPARGVLPDNCDTVWWDPMTSTCLCNSSSCAYKDVSVPVAPNSGSNTTTNTTTGKNNTSNGSGAAVGAAVGQGSFVAMMVAVIVAVVMSAV